MEKRESRILRERDRERGSERFPTQVQAREAAGVTGEGRAPLREAKERRRRWGRESRAPFPRREIPKAPPTTSGAFHLHRSGLYVTHAGRFSAHWLPLLPVRALRWGPSRNFYDGSGFRLALVAPRPALLQGGASLFVRIPSCSFGAHPPARSSFLRVFSPPFLLVVLPFFVCSLPPPSFC